MTRVFGILGYPISHSLSPVMHNAAFQVLGLDAVYSSFEVPPSTLGRVLEALKVCGVDGLNVTVPHKEWVFRYLHRRGACDRVASAIGAVNTLMCRKGRFVGYNTDVIGFVRALEELGWRHGPCSAAILGAGGAAEAIAWALTRYDGTWLTIANRHIARAERLVRWLQPRRPRCRIRAQSLKAFKIRGQDLLVNATSLGLRPDDPLPVDPAAIHKQLVVVDLVYRSPTTKLVREARRRGALAIDGLPMLVYQGAESFRLWWRRQPPIDVMRRAVEQAVRQQRVDSP